MMKKWMRWILTVCVTALLLTGCGAAVLPEMSDYEYERFVNYTAGFLVRYSKGSVDKLTYLDPSYTPDYLLAQSVTEEPAETTPVPVPEPEPVAVTPPAPVQTEDDGQDEPDEEPANNPVTEDDGDADTGTEENVPAEVAFNTVPIYESRLQSLADGVSVEYMGYSVRNHYPDAQAQGAVSAAQGDRLLIVDFRLRNITGEMVNINTAFMGPQYKLIINNDIQGFTLVTMIENDLSSLLTAIPAGGYIDAVLLMELPEDLARNISSLSVVIQYGPDAQTVRLE